jgi:hypothetical protein
LERLAGPRPFFAQLSESLDNARKELGRGRPSKAEDELEHLLKDVDEMVRSGRLTGTDAAPLRSIVGRAIRSLSLQEDADDKDKGKDKDNNRHNNKDNNDNNKDNDRDKH